jgi:hypothetical protein
MSIFRSIRQPFGFDFEMNRLTLVGLVQNANTR